MQVRQTTICFAFLLALVGCAPLARVAAPPHAELPAISNPVPIQVRTRALASQAACTNSFVSHTLDFSTVVADDAVHLFDSNGAGVAIGDLDGDGQLDLVFANLDGPNTIFWNQGDFAFRPETLDDTHARAANIVDVDGDGRLDIVFTHRAGGVSYWHNADGAHFVQTPLARVLQPAYSMAWGDLNGDGLLDLVTGSYDAELGQRQMNTFLWSGGAGVYAYTQQPNGAFVAQRLANTAQALAIALPDLNGNGEPSIMVGNDFTMPDAVWQRAGEQWAAATPFVATSESTMSIDTGDIDNDGHDEIFTTDMKPYDVATHTLASWLPMMARMPQVHDPHDPQIMENVLQVRGSDGRFHNEAAARGIDASGWSWSGKFGDLDNDGFVDVYVVNGMIATELFHHLPHDELVEQNQAFHNDGSGHFSPAPQWALGAAASGRGMSMADLDGDGNLDIVVNNLRAPAQIFENRVCGGASVEVDVRWPSSKNTRALGARLALHTSAGTYYRAVRAGSGYLSGDAARVHLGFPAGATLQRLDITWPDGRVSSIDAPAARMLLTVTRDT